MVVSNRALYAVAALLLLTLLYTLFLATFTPRHLSLSLRSARLLQADAAHSDLALSLSYHVANPNAFPVRVAATSAEVRQQDGASLASVGVPVGAQGPLAAGASQNVAATLAMHVRRQRDDAVLALVAVLTVHARGSVFHVFSPRVSGALACSLHVDLLLANSSVSAFEC